MQVLTDILPYRHTLHFHLFEDYREPAASSSNFSEATPFWIFLGARESWGEEAIRNKGKVTTRHLGTTGLEPYFALPPPNIHRESVLQTTWIQMPHLWGIL